MPTETKQDYSKTVDKIHDDRFQYTNELLDLIPKLIKAKTIYENLERERSELERKLVASSISSDPAVDVLNAVYRKHNRPEPFPAFRVKEKSVFQGSWV